MSPSPPDTCSNQATPLPSRLLDLPLEIRVEIYRHLFAGSQLSLDLSHHVPASHCRPPVCTCRFPWPITAICRQLRRESLPLLLAATTLTIPTTLDRVQDVPRGHRGSIPHAVVLDVKAFAADFPRSSLICHPPTPPLTHFLPHCLPRLRTLELRNLTIWCQFHSEAFLESPEADDCMINLAMFNLRRTSPRLVELCDRPRSSTPAAAVAATTDGPGGGGRHFQILLCCQYVGSSLRHETIVSYSLSSLEYSFCFFFFPNKI